MWGYPYDEKAYYQRDIIKEARRKILTYFINVSENHRHDWNRGKID